MIDRDIELKIKRVKEFIQLWIKFHDMYKNALSRDTITPEEETAFLETKSLIARRYQALKDFLGLENSYDDKTFDVISQVLSLKSVAVISDLSLNKIENDWHNSYILLNKIFGELEGKKDSLRKVNWMGLEIKKMTMNPVFNLLMIVVIIVGVYIFSMYLKGNYKIELELGNDGKVQEEKKPPESKIEFRYDTSDGLNQTEGTLE